MQDRIPHPQIYSFPQAPSEACLPEQVRLMISSLLELGWKEVQIEEGRVVGLDSIKREFINRRLSQSTGPITVGDKTKVNLLQLVTLSREGREKIYLLGDPDVQQFIRVHQLKQDGQLQLTTLHKSFDYRLS